MSDQQVAKAPDTPDTNDALEGVEPEALARFWLGAIAEAARYFEPWCREAANYYERYRDNRATDHAGQYAGVHGAEREAIGKRFNIFWSNVNTMKPALYQGPAKPNVNRRFKDADPIGRVAVEIEERALEYVIDTPAADYSYDAAMNRAVDDRLLSGRGVVWWKYEADIVHHDAVAEERDEGGLVTAAAVEAYDEKVGERVCPIYVEYDSYLQMPERTEEELLREGWKARKVCMTRAQLVKRFGAEIGNAVKLTVTRKPSEPDKSIQRTIGDQQKGGIQAEVWEIWNVPDRKVYWISKGYDKPLDVQDDPLNLINFFPSPKPLFATTTPDSPLPIPDFREYKDQALNLDRITQKIWQLTVAIRIAGFYPGEQAQEMQRLFDGSAGNKMIPIKDWAAAMAKGGVRGMVDWMPLEPIISALNGLYQAAEFNKQQIYEITGIADIVRGQSAASETLGAQRLKGQWAGLRLQASQDAVANFQRDNQRIAAEIMVEHFSPETLAEITNFANTKMAQDPRMMALFQQAVTMLRDDRARSFRVDVETDDTVFADEGQERAQRIEMITALGSFLEKAIQGAQAAPELGPLLGEMMMFGLRSFEGGRQLEFAAEQAVMAMAEKARQAQQGPKQPSPLEIAARADAQAKTQKSQTDMMNAQTNRLKVVADAQDKQQQRAQDAEELAQKQREDIRDAAVAIRGQNMQYQNADKQRLADVMRQL